MLLALRAHPEYPLVIAANRDEFYARPTAAAGFWEDSPRVLAGRDLVCRGTWLGVDVGVRRRSAQAASQGMKRYWAHRRQAEPVGSHCNHVKH